MLKAKCNYFIQHFTSAFSADSGIYDPHKEARRASSSTWATAPEDHTSLLSDRNRKLRPPWLSMLRHWRFTPYYFLRSSFWDVCKHFLNKLNHLKESLVIWVCLGVTFPMNIPTRHQLSSQAETLPVGYESTLRMKELHHRELLLVEKKARVMPHFITHCWHPDSLILFNYGTVWFAQYTRSKSQQEVFERALLSSTYQIYAGFSFDPRKAYFKGQLNHINRNSSGSALMGTGLIKRLDV